MDGLQSIRVGVLLEDPVTMVLSHADMDIERFDDTSEMLSRWAALFVRRRVNHDSFYLRAISKQHQPSF